ncbi:MAG: arginine--tRNA ligase [Halobacteriovoraceae bacterium]|nr:arginine--tRNA ligase [Halobacteriovoraceae bacterium]
MKPLYNSVLLTLSQFILERLELCFPGHGQSLEEIYHSIGDAPNLKMGHFAYPCFPLAKSCRMAPPKISGQLEACQSQLPPQLASAVAAGPYFNFFFKPEGLADLFLEELLDGRFFEQKITENYPKTMVEYSQPNTHKILHVGHMRNLCLGNAVVRLHRYLGHEVVSTTYPGDVGTHVAKTLWYMKYHNNEPTPEENRGAWLGKMYTLANHKLEDELGSESEDQNRQQLTEILVQLEKKEGEFYLLWKETRQWSLALMKEAYAWAGVEFDRWFFESEVDSPSLEFAKELHKSGKLVESEGAIGMDLSEDKLGFCLMIKRDGTGLYATKDVELAKVKFEEFGIEQSIYIVDNRQAHHFRQVFKLLEKIGFEQAQKCLHLQYDVVELPDGAMSSRQGNIVPLMDLVHSMEKAITKNYLERYRGVWTDAEINETSSMVANGAIKYGMIRMDNNRKIVFDSDEWLKLHGETGPYLQYVHARIHSLCEKLEYKKAEGVQWQLLQKSQELALLVKLSSFNSTIETAALQFKTMQLTGYLFELGKLFNSFYAECPIGKADNEPLKQARLALAKAVGQVMHCGLDLLGIPAPKKM